MKDVAREADVSVATVSLVFNNKGNINRATRQKILAVARKMGYERNRAPGAPRHRPSLQTKAVGVLAPRQSWGNDESVFAQRILLGIERELARHSLHCVFASFDPREQDEAIPVMLEGRDVDGVILVIGSHRTWLERILETVRKNAVPVIMVCYPGDEFGLPSVVMDNLEAAYRATTCLLDCGYPEVATIAGPPESPSALARLRGYRLALIEHGRTADDRLIRQGDYLELAGHRAMAALLDAIEPPFGLFAANDLTARGAIKLLRERNLRVPEDVGLIGFDDIESVALKTVPRLSTVHVPYEEMGVQAVRQMISYRTGTDTPPRITVPCSLVLRGSTPPAEEAGGNREPA